MPILSELRLRIIYPKIGRTKRYETISLKCGLKSGLLIFNSYFSAQITLPLIIEKLGVLPHRKLACGSISRICAERKTCMKKS